MLFAEPKSHQYSYREGETNHDLDEIKKVLGDHDSNGQISFQVYQHLQSDQISLSLLSEFDDKTLNEMIDSWNINTFNKKTFLIRGILINGIKKLRNKNPNPNSNAASCNNFHNNNCGRNGNENDANIGNI